jgi:hypothetical protein
MRTMRRSIGIVTEEWRRRSADAVFSPEGEAQTAVPAAGLEEGKRGREDVRRRSVTKTVEGCCGDTEPDEEKPSDDVIVMVQ